MTESAYKYTGNNGTVYQMDIDNRWASALGFVAAAGTEPLWGQETSPRYLNAVYQVSGVNVAIPCICPTQAIASANIDKTVTISGVGYYFSAFADESSLLIPINLVIQGPPGSPGPAGPEGPAGPPLYSSEYDDTEGNVTFANGKIFWFDNPITSFICPNVGTDGIVDGASCVLIASSGVGAIPLSAPGGAYLCDINETVLTELSPDNYAYQVYVVYEFESGPSTNYVFIATPNV